MSGLAATGDRPSIVLASASATRAGLLARAGIEAVLDPAAVDEDEIKASMRAAGAPPEDTAEALAELKAKRVSARRRGALVIGADQMLVCNDVWFDKPPDRAHAHAQLAALAGKTHRLVSAVVVVRDGAPLWHHHDEARLTMRPFDDAFIARYLDAVGDAAMRSVGAYQLEGLGVHLFARVEGDWFTILGLPLLPLLGFLREHRAVPS
jgi:septum formation protein